MRRATKETLPWIGLAAALAVALVLRLINIQAEPYWGDEVLSLDISTTFHTVHRMVHYLADVEFHPPLYYLMLRGWTALFGTAEAATRALSLIFGLGVVAGGYVAGERLLGSRRAGLVAAFVLAVLPMQIEYGQEARPYIIFTFCGVVAMLALWEYLRRGQKRRYAAIFAVASIAGMYLHYSYLFILGPLSMWWLFEILSDPERRNMRAFIDWLVANAAVAVAFFFWSTPFLNKIFIGQYPIFGLMRRITPYRRPSFIESTLHNLVWLNKLDYITKVEVFAELLAEVALAWGTVVLLVDRAKRGILRRTSRAVLFLVWMTVAPVTLFMIAPQSVDYTTIVQRHVLFVTFPIALLVAWVVSSLNDKRGALILALFLISLLTSIAFVCENDYKWDYDFRLQEAGQYVDAHYKDGDLMVVSVSILRSDLDHYLLPQIPVNVMLPIDFYGLDIWNTRHSLGLVENEVQVRIPKATPPEIWHKMDELDKLYHPKRIWLYGFASSDYAVREWFSQHGWRTVYRPIGDIFRVELYQQR